MIVRVDVVLKLTRRGAILLMVLEERCTGDEDDVEGVREGKSTMRSMVMFLLIWFLFDTMEIKWES